MSCEIVAGAGWFCGNIVCWAMEDESKWIKQEIKRARHLVSYC